MKRLIIASALVIAGCASAYAGGFMLLHVGQGDSNGVSTPSALLINTGSVMLINTGSKLLIHN